MSKRFLASIVKRDPRQLVIPALLFVAFFVFFGRLVYIQAIEPSSAGTVATHHSGRAVVAARSQEDLARKILRKLSAARSNPIDLGRRIRNRLSRMR
jgi:hypothetical protein